MKIKLVRTTTAGLFVTLGILGAVALVLTVVGIGAWEYTNSNAFCANVCHAVHPEEPVAHAVSSHARVNCVECHMGRLSTVQLMLIKPTHLHELWGMIVGYERPHGATSMRPARDSCEACHWPAVRHSDTVRTKVRYEADPKSRETRTTLVMHTGTGEARTSGTKGIHWHVGQELTYAATDAAKQKIVWVQAKGADGKATTWYDPTSGVTPQQIDKLEKRRMDCIDCHNASGHPFPNPADLVDQAIVEERISRKIPAVKARSEALIKKADGLKGTVEERGKLVDAMLAADSSKDPKGAGSKEEKDFAAEMKRILLNTSFAGTETWRTFPSNVGHKDFPGCFRCHDGKHLDSNGLAIRLQCTLCHALPQVVREDGIRSVASTVSPDLTPLPSHSEPNFMHDHRSKVDDSCKMCHGKIQWGTEGGSFCSNPACHGRKWPEMNLDAQAASPPATKPKEGKGT